MTRQYTTTQARNAYLAKRTLLDAKVQRCEPEDLLRSYEMEDLLVPFNEGVDLLEEANIIETRQRWDATIKTPQSVIDELILRGGAGDYCIVSAGWAGTNEMVSIVMLKPK